MFNYSLMTKTRLTFSPKRHIGSYLRMGKKYSHGLSCLHTLIRRNVIVSSQGKSVNISQMTVFTSAQRFNPPSNTSTLTTQQAQELALRLTADERKFLLNALQEFESKSVKDEYEGQLAAHRWRSKFGRPSKVPKLGDVDPTGTYCPVPEDWLKRKYAATVPTPSTSELFHLAVANSIPFIGFGFLDNFIMIVAGENIDHVLGSYICMSTMAAAALGNTFSDVIGIGSAFYVERFAEKIGFQPPKLTPIQLDMKISRRFANLGRVLGITIGCIIGMIPLLFISSDPKKPPDTDLLAATLLHNQTESEPQSQPQNQDKAQPDSQPQVQLLSK